MTFSPKRSIALLILLTATRFAQPMSYHDMTKYAAGSIAAVVTGTMLYNYAYPQCDICVYNEDVTKTAKDALDLNIVCVRTYQNVLSIVEQNSLDADFYPLVKSEFHYLADRLALYHYVSALERHISQLQKAIDALTHLETRMINNLKKFHTCCLNAAQDCQDEIATIEATKSELQTTLTKLIILNRNLINTTQYALEYEEDRQMGFAQEYKNEDTSDTPIINPVKKEVLAEVIVETQIMDENVVANSAALASSMTFDSHIWCDRTDPFNS